MSTAKTKKYFGTDGIRGLANHGPLNVSQVLGLGEATARVLSRQGKSRVRVGLGWDTRQSSPALVSALSAGLASGGAEVLRFGVIPTPAVSVLTRSYRLDAGIVVSASHNPAEDNGIKYFGADGGKFPDARERLLERALHVAKPRAARTGVDVGMIKDVFSQAVLEYSRILLQRFAKRKLAKMRIVADLAHGATCRTVPLILEQLKINTRFLYDQPDGRNINVQCGSTHPQNLAKQVRALRAQAGLAFDGDGDRVMLVDEKGAVVNGDRILGILGDYYARKGWLVNRVVVSTVMSNLGLELYLRSRGIRLVRAQVGDRYVAEKMRHHGAILGGEQSGHILLPLVSPAGDGLLTALEVLAVMQETGKPLSELAGGWQDFPQLLVNIPVTTRPDLLSLPSVKSAVAAAQHGLRERGRVNLRYSGTEPLARVMVEAENAAAAENWAQQIGDAVEAAIGSGQRRIATWLTCA